jgi:PHD/YefM family antitoxin component YafN of YafNO toxin-antitoxin module
MKVTEVSTRDFRENQKEFFEKADRGEKFVIKRRNQYYTLIAVSANDLDLSFSETLDKKLSTIQAKK